MLEKALKAIEQVNLKDVRVFDLENKNPFYQYVIVATQSSNRQGEALIGYMKEEMKHSFEIKGIEGQKTGWLLLDLGDVIVHVFTEEMRQYYLFDDRFIGIKEIK